MSVEPNFSAYPDLPSYLRPYSYQTSSQSYHQGIRSPSLSPTFPPSPELDMPPSKRFAAGPALPPSSYYPPPHLFRPVNFETPTGNIIHRPNALPPTPSDSYCSDDRGSDSPSPIGGTQSIIGKDANYTSNGITASLMEADLWRSFNSVGNEMIVTKPGRRLFPSLLVSLRGLEPKTDYTISLRIAPVDQYRYKFISMRWVAVGESEILQDEGRQVYKHPNNPKSGSFWMRKPISFKPCKITHNPRSKNGNILLHTMHKYVMEIIVTRANADADSSTTICLKATEFVAVSAYQNTGLTQLKIDNNPFAKGFRDRDFVPAINSIHPSFPPPAAMFNRPLSWELGLPSVPRIIPSAEMTPGPSSNSPSPTFFNPHIPQPPPDYSRLIPQPPPDYSKLIPQAQTDYSKQMSQPPPDYSKQMFQPLPDYSKPMSQPLPDYSSQRLPYPFPYTLPPPPLVNISESHGPSGYQTDCTDDV